MTEALERAAERASMRVLLRRIAERAPEFVGAPLPGTTRDRYPWSPRHVAVWAQGELDAAGFGLPPGWRVRVENSEAELRYGVLSIHVVDPAGVPYSIWGLSGLTERDHHYAGPSA